MASHFFCSPYLILYSNYFSFPKWGDKTPNLPPGSALVRLADLSIFVQLFSILARDNSFTHQVFVESIGSFGRGEPGSYCKSTRSFTSFLQITIDKNKDFTKTKVRFSEHLDISSSESVLPTNGYNLVHSTFLPSVHFHLLSFFFI